MFSLSIKIFFLLSCWGCAAQSYWTEAAEQPLVTGAAETETGTEVGTEESIADRIHDEIAAWKAKKMRELNFGGLRFNDSRGRRIYRHRWERVSSSDPDIPIRGSYSDMRNIARSPQSTTISRAVSLRPKINNLQCTMAANNLDRKLYESSCANYVGTPYSTQNLNSTLASPKFSLVSNAAELNLPFRNATSDWLCQLECQVDNDCIYWQIDLSNSTVRSKTVGKNDTTIQVTVHPCYLFSRSVLSHIMGDSREIVSNFLYNSTKVDDAINSGANVSVIIAEVGLINSEVRAGPKIWGPNHMSAVKTQKHPRANQVFAEPATPENSPDIEVLEDDSPTGAPTSSDDDDGINWAMVGGCAAGASLAMTIGVTGYTHYVKKSKGKNSTLKETASSGDVQKEGEHPSSPSDLETPAAEVIEVDQQGFS